MSVHQRFGVEFEIAYRTNLNATVSITVYVEPGQGKEVAIVLAFDRLRNLIAPEYDVTSVTAMEITS